MNLVFFLEDMNPCRQFQRQCRHFSKQFMICNLPRGSCPSHHPSGNQRRFSPQPPAGERHTKKADGARQPIRLQRQQTDKWPRGVFPRTWSGMTGHANIFFIQLKILSMRTLPRVRSGWSVCMSGHTRSEIAGKGLRDAPSPAPAHTTPPCYGPLRTACAPNSFFPQQSLLCRMGLF
jgi:hypothetical protein